MGYILRDIEYKGGTNVNNTTVTIDNNYYNYTPATGNFLAALVIKPEQDETVDVGLTAGGTDYEQGLQLEAGKNYTITINEKFENNEQIYVSGLNGPATLSPIYI